MREHLPRDTLDHRMRRRGLFELGELGLCALEILGPEQRGNESVMRRDLIVELALGDRVFEKQHGIPGGSFVAFQQRADHLEVERVGDLPKWLGERARLRFGDALVGLRVIVKVGRRIALEPHRRLLQPLEKAGHGVGIEAGGVGPLEAKAVGFVFDLAGEVDLALDREALRRGNRALRHIAARRRLRTRGEDSGRNGAQGHKQRIALIPDAACDMVLRDVCYFVSQNRRELGFALRQQDQPGVYADEASGQGECVDRRIGHRKKLEVEWRTWNRRYQPVA